MRARLIRLYHAMPPVTRSVAASAWGYVLRYRRYGRDLEARVAAAEARERWSPERWAGHREERLAEALHHAATRVPYYRDLWSRRRAGGDSRSWERLEHWPVLDKAPLRAHPRAFLADGERPENLHVEHTSGTTGTPLTLWWSREALREWYALFELRTRRWYGLSKDDRWAMAGGQLVAPVEQDAPPFWVWNAGMRQLYLSSYHLAPRFIPAYLDAMRRYRVRHLLCYTSAAYALAQGALSAGIAAPRLDVVVTNAEPVYEFQREAIARAFGCPVRETYGLSEGVAAATQCAHGTLHWWPDVGVIEALTGGEPVAAGASGDLVCTGFLNRAMPLIRYAVGDTGVLGAPDRAACACGRTLPVLSSVEGRTDDVLITRDGRAVGRLDTVFKADFPIREAQIIQETRARVRVRLVPTAGYDARAAAAIRASLRGRLGDLDFILEEVDVIARTANGKFRAVVSLLSPEERAASQRP